MRNLCKTDYFVKCHNNSSYKRQQQFYGSTYLEQRLLTPSRLRELRDSQLRSKRAIDSRFQKVESAME